MYNIIQLNDKDLSELQTIAHELGIKKTDSLKKEELVYKILDEQAIAGATKKVAADKLKEERNEDKKKRSRVAVKKENKVFSATKNGEITKAETTAPAPATKAQAQEAATVKQETATPATETPAAAPKKKVGRPRKNPVVNKPVEEQPAAKEEKEVVVTETKKAEEEKKTEAKPASKPISKPASKPISKPIIKPKAPAVVDEESKILSESSDDDFIPIEDLPSEKVELPTELFGKFESTKAETITLPAPEQAQNQPRPRVIRPRDNNNNSNNNGRFNGNNNNNGNNRFNNRNNNDRFNKRPLDEKGIEKNIKNIMSVETVEKESVREYNRGIDKQKNNNKFEENKGKKSKSRRNNSAGDFDEGKLKSLKQANRLSNMFDEQDGGMLDYYDLTTERGRRGKKRKNQNQEERTKQKIFRLTEIEIPETVTVKDLAADMKKTTAEVIKKLLGYGIMATINQEIDFDTAYLIAQEFGITATKKETVTEEDILFDDSEDKEEELETRPPVIVVMGHVDHGKTSLLDAVRKTNVIEGEAGGITQAIGAYKVKVKDREITFLDTPGHEAFTAMRARGAQITDIAILVVAANDGVKPQTIEAINHAKSAGIPIIVAINKIDLPDANIEKVKQELMAYELVPEEWGGDTIYVPISAKKGENIDQLLEMVLLEADVLELKANPHKQAKGAVIEARLDKSKGAIATMLVQRGTLDVGDTIVVGSSIGRIRAMKDDKGKSVKAAGPSTPVEIMGLTEVPEAGDTFYEVKNEKMAKHLIERRKRQAREKAINSATKVTLDNLFTQMEQGNLKVLNLIVKADVQGSVEAVKQAMEKLENEEVKVKVIHAAAGAVNQSDVTLAKVSNAIIIAFNVRPDNMAKEMAEKDEVEIKQYSIIYQAIEDVEAAMKGMLDPKYEEKVIGNAEVRQTFKISNVGTIAGCYVISGKVERNAGVRVIRENVVIHDGHLATLKRFKDDVKEVTKGFECGIQIENYNDIKEGDVIEVYIMEEIKR